MKSHSVEQGEKHHDEATDAERGDRFILIRNFIQEGWNVNPVVSCLPIRRAENGSMTDD